MLACCAKGSEGVELLLLLFKVSRATVGYPPKKPNSFWRLLLVGILLDVAGGLYYIYYFFLETK